MLQKYFPSTPEITECQLYAFVFTEAPLTTSHWSLSASVSLWMELISQLGTFSISLCRSSTVLMSWSMSACFSLSSSWMVLCYREHSRGDVNRLSQEGETQDNVEVRGGFLRFAF